MSDPKDMKPAVNPEDQALIESAQRTQELFKKSPKVVITSMGDDPMKEAVREFLPEAVPQYDDKGRMVKKPTKAAFFATESQLKAKAARGYELVMDKSGHRVTIGDNSEMVLMSRPMGMAVAEDLANKDKNAEKTANMKKLLKRDSRTPQERGESAESFGTSPDRSGVKVEELSIESGQIVQ